MRKMREFVRSNKWRTVRLTNAHKSVKRRSFMQQMGFNNELKQQFQAEAGGLESFCDLLNHMIMFEWERRYTVTQCIDHPFFSEYKLLIDETRKKYQPKCRPEQVIVIRDCVERKWMADAATEIFNNRGRLHWYTHRALFQAMDLFDRYLYVMFHSASIPTNAVESDLKGLIHDKFGAELRFMTCLYLCIKYFSSIHQPVKFDTIVAKEYCTKEAKLIAEQFEGGFIKNCLEYDIYRPTVYESADDFNDKLEDPDIRDLIMLYSMNNTFSGMKASELYQHYRTHLRGQPIEILFSPLIKSSVETSTASSDPPAELSSPPNKAPSASSSKPNKKDTPVKPSPPGFNNKVTLHTPIGPSKHIHAITRSTNTHVPPLSFQR